MKRVAIIGAGLAGTACAHVLKNRGFEPVIYESGAAVAQGASGNPLGLYNPRLSADRTAESDFYSAAFALGLRTFGELKDISWNKCGSLHLINDEKKDKKFRQCAANWGWPEDSMRILSAKEASEAAGISLEHEALFLPASGTVSPRKLCETYSEGIEIHFNAETKTLDDISADVIILAGGMGVKKFADLPLNAVRGQITWVKPSHRSEKLRANLCYGGYMTPITNGTHMVGSTFQRWLDHADIIEQDDKDNLADLAQNVSSLGGDYKVASHRAAVRTTNNQHFPIVGPLASNIYVSTAHGSHGIISTIMSAHLIADMIQGGPLCLPKETVEKLSPVRYGAVKLT